MKSMLLSQTPATLILAVILTGCGQAPHQPPASPPNPSSPTAAVANQEAAAPAAPGPVESTSKNPPIPPSPVLPTALAQIQTDPVLADIGRELQATVAKIGATLTSDAPLKEKLDQAIQAGTQGQEINALEYFQQVITANLTPQQTGLVKQAGEVLSAFMVQKNFGGLEGAESEIGQIVTALRKGEPATAIAPLQKVASNAQLTDTQKQLLSGIAEQYAPAVGSLIKNVKENLKGLKF